MYNTPLISPLFGLYRHRKTVRAMGSLALSSLRKRGSPLPLEQSAVGGDVPRFDAALGAAFLRCTSGEVNAFKLPGGKTAVPPTFYVTWNMAILAQSLMKARLPYDFSRALHALSEVRYSRPLFSDTRARYSGRIVSIDDNERRARIRFETIINDHDGDGEIFRNLRVEQSKHAFEKADRRKRAA